MSKVVKTLFGGTDRSAQKATKQANARTLDFIKQQGQVARQDAIPLFGSAFENRNLGAQAALDVFGQTIPQQFGTFQQGNVGAQQQLLAGLPQFQNAILGLPADLSGLQPQTIDVDTSFAQQQLPEFVSPQQALPQQTQPQGFNVSQFLAGRRG